MAEAEELRRKAFEDHAWEKIKQGREAAEETLYLDAKLYYVQALAALGKAGERPENREARNVAKMELREVIYQQGVAYLKGGDLDTAEKFAREATFQGHRKGPQLVEDVEAARQKPPPKPKPPEHRWRQEDFLKQEADIAKLLKEGREFWMSGELDRALQTFESVLARDAFNTGAIRWRAKVAQRRYELASLELESTRRDMVADIRKTWNPRDYEVAEGPPPDDTTTKKIDENERLRREIIDKMNLIVIPEIDFRQANIHDVVDFLQEASVDYDPAEDPKDRKGVNIILHLGTTAADMGAPAAAPASDDFFKSLDAAGPAGGSDVPLITFRARDISLHEAMKIVTEVANLKYRIDGKVVLIVPFDAPDGKIIHRMYDVLPTVSDRIMTIGGALGTGGGGGLDDFGGPLGGGGIEGETTD